MTGKAHRIMTGATALRLLCAAIVVLLSAGPALAQAPTATTAVVSGTVSDPSGLVVPGATVMLTDPATTRSVETVTDSSGHYTFAGVFPGTYVLTTNLKGFKQSRIADIGVEVARSYTVNITLGSARSKRSSTSRRRASSCSGPTRPIGTTLHRHDLLRLPNPTRELTSIQFNQPLADPVPGRGREPCARRARLPAREATRTPTRSTAPTSPTTWSERTSSRPSPLPAFRCPPKASKSSAWESTNPNATFARASGGQLVVVTKRGTNSYRGSLYLVPPGRRAEREQLDARARRSSKAGVEGQPVRHVDRRARFHDRTFFFTQLRGPALSALGRHHASRSDARVEVGIMRVPRRRQAIIVNYNIRDWDPRGIGLNPVVRDLFDTLPAGQHISLGDGLNVIGFAASPDTSFNSDFAVLRLDHNLSTELANRRELSLCQHQ